jgi:hypothetical protein
MKYPSVVGIFPRPSPMFDGVLKRSAFFYGISVIVFLYHYHFTFFIFERPPIVRIICHDRDLIIVKVHFLR